MVSDVPGEPLEDEMSDKAVTDEQITKNDEERAEQRFQEYSTGQQFVLTLSKRQIACLRHIFRTQDQTGFVQFNTYESRNTLDSLRRRGMILDSKPPQLSKVGAATWFLLEMAGV